MTEESGAVTEAVNEAADEGVELREYTDEDESTQQPKSAPEPREAAPKDEQEQPKTKFNDVGKGEAEATAEAIEDADISDEQMSQLIKTLGLPDGVSYFKDKKGAWKFIVPMDGKKFQQTLPEIIRGFNLSQVGHQRLSKAKESEKKFTEWMGGIKEDPSRLWQLADHVGIDKFDLAQGLLQQAVAEAEMSPEEKAQAQKMQEAEELRRENEQLKSQNQRAEYQRQVETEREKLSADFVDAFKEMGFKPFTPGEDRNETRKKCTLMAHSIGLMSLAHQHGRELTAKDAVFMAKQEFQANIMDMINDIDPTRLTDVLPQELVEAIRQADIAKITKGRTPTAAGGEFGEPVELDEYEDDDALPRKKRRKKKATINEFFDSL